MRVDANHAMNPQYVPNSFVHKFRPDTAEAPYQVSDSIVGRKSHYYHEGKLSEYDQPRTLYRRVMNDKARRHLHANTARLLKLVDNIDVQIKYLAQLFCIAPEYGKGVFDQLPPEQQKRFSYADVKQRAKGAEKAGKEPKFMPSLQSDKLVGMCPAMTVYNV